MNPQIQITNTEFLHRLEGQVTEGYPLDRLLGRGDSHATYVTKYGENARAAVIKLLDGSSRAAQTQLARWAAISRVSHPNLSSLLDYGKCEIDDIPVLYVVTEWAEDNLDSVLARRPLTVVETKEMLEPILGVLSHLHQHGFVHGAIKPSNILANGDQLKLASDSITAAGDLNAGHESSLHGPPESNPGIASFPGDVWSLGVTLVQALTQNIPKPVSENGGSAVEAEFAASRNLPEPFLDIVRHCLRRDPDIRWTVSQISARLGGASSAPLPVPQQVVIAEVAPIPPTEKKGRPKWLYPLFGLLAAIAIFAVLYSTKRTDSPATAITTTASIPKTLEEPKGGEPVESQAPPAPVAPEAQTAAPVAAAETPRSDVPVTANKPSSFGKTTKRAGRGPGGNEWFVVAAAYGKRNDAEAKVASIKRRWPNFKAEVYPPTDAPLYLVILGSNLSREAASSLQANARSVGLPRDTYITNRLATP